MSGRIRKVTLFVLLCAGMAATARAQIYGTGDRVAGTIEDQAMITLDVKDRPLADVLAHIQGRVGVNIVLAPGVEGSVTIDLKDIPWRDALRLVRGSCRLHRDREVEPALSRGEASARDVFLRGRGDQERHSRDRQGSQC
jgi:type II secretory pathway component HofQ